MDHRRWRQRCRRVSVAVSMATEHMRDGATRAIRRWAHTTGVVFRVGTPGRLAGRCLWPSLSSRKSKATGVVAVPFSSAFPLVTFFVFYPLSLLRLLLFFLVLYFPCVFLSPLVLIVFAFLSFLCRVVSFYRARIVSKSLSRWASRTRVSGTCETVVIRLHPS